MLSSTIGGYLAGRLRTKWVGVHTHEVYFRDTAHGFLAWGLATVLSAAALASSTAHIVGAASTGFVQAASPATAQSSSPIDPIVDRMFRSDRAANQAGDDPTAPRAEIGRLLTASLHGGGDLAQADRIYVAQVVAQSTGLSLADAEKRVSEVVTQAKVTADNARKGAMKLSLWLTASMLIGAFAASLAATEGGQLRDGAWNSSGMVGKCFMIHAGHQMFAKFPERIGQYKAPPGLAITEHFNRTMPDVDFSCGYTIEVIGPHVVDFAGRITTARNLWGSALRRAMFDYNYYSGLMVRRN